MDETRFTALLTDVRAEADELLATLRSLTDAQWLTDTPAQGWDIRDQVVHLAFFDEIAELALVDPAAFRSEVSSLTAAGADWVDQINERHRDRPPGDVLAWFEAARNGVLGAFLDAGPNARCPWFGPPMSSASSATARLMETWAHGQDIYDAIGGTHPLTDRVRHVCHLGVITRGFSYSLRGLPAPSIPIRVELIGPDETTWSWGPADAPDRITGSAADFALVVTQRRHCLDTGLRATKGLAAEWLSIAQAFAGNAGTGRQPGQFLPP